MLVFIDTKMMTGNNEMRLVSYMATFWSVKNTLMVIEYPMIAKHIRTQMIIN